jgi:hypothetical protein
MNRWCVCAAVTGWIWCGRLSAQVDFVSAARAGTARYQRQAAAIEDGYRKVGPDFPGMGEHWVNPGLLVAAVLDPSRPPVLEYAMIGGEPKLVGVAYAALVTDSTWPPGLLLPSWAWHTHAGTLDQESFILNHAGVRHTDHPSSGPRVAVAHAWVWLANPAGLYETDNWALPCARLGFTPPAGLSADAGRALALAAGATAYFETLVRVVGAPDSAESVQLRAVLDQAAAEVAQRVGRGTGQTPLDPQFVPWLESAWRRAWMALLTSASPPVRHRLADLKGA